MTVRALTTSFANIAKGTFIPAALVAAGRGIPRFTQTHTTSLEALQKFGSELHKAGNLAYGQFTNLTMNDLPGLVHAVPIRAQSAWEKGWDQMTIAAVWGGTSTLTNEVLKRIPGIKNQMTLRAVVSILVGAGAAAAACEFGLGKTPNPHMFVDTALKVATIALPYMAVTATVDTAFGFAGASSSALAAIITTTCKVGQTVTRALSLPGSLRLIDAPGASGTLNVDPKAQDAIALNIQAQLTAGQIAPGASSQQALLDRLTATHPGLTPGLAKAIALHAWENKPNDGAAAKSSSRRRPSRKEKPVVKTDVGTGATADVPAPADDGADKLSSDEESS